VVGFYLLYVWYWAKAKVKGLTGAEAYYAIPFEKEAYENQSNFKYLNDRRPHAWRDFT
jgi:hypothetical protein